MGLSLNNIYQRPYVNQDAKSRVKRRADEEQTTSTKAQRQESANPNARSKGLQYTQEQKPAYTPNYAQSFAASAYSNVNINSNKVHSQGQATSYIQNVQENHTEFNDTQINIAQILKDFKNTAIAIGTPENISEEVDGYIALVEKQVTKDNPNVKLIKSNLKNAASLLDGHISETLNKESKVVEVGCDSPWEPELKSYVIVYLFGSQWASKITSASSLGFKFLNLVANTFVGLLESNLTHFLLLL